MSKLNVGLIGGINATNNTISVQSGHTLYIPGTVVQMVDYKYPSSSDSYTTISGYTKYQTPISITITPKFANSKLVVHAEAQTRTIAGVGTTVGLRRDGVEVPGSLNYNTFDFFYKGDSVNHHKNMHINTSFVAGSTAPTTFNVWVMPYGDTGEWNTGWGNNYIQVWEIAQ